MEKEQKILKLNNRSLEQFDKLMSYHLDMVEELEINEININPKLYNIIGLCTNLKQLSIKGDLRTDVNKIVFSVCKPENIETLILNSVKLPTNKVISKFSGLTTISLNNITFSNLAVFFDNLSAPENVIALNLTNVDFGKSPISVCKVFKNLKYFNLDGLKNCNFDSFEFVFEDKKINRFEFCNNTINVENVNSLVKGSYTRKIDVNLETSEECKVLNSLEIKDKKIYITVNACDLNKVVESVSLYKLTNLFIVLGNDVELAKYIKKFKKIKGDIIIAIDDISYFSIQNARDFRDKLGVEYINVLESPTPLKLADKIQCYMVDNYIEIVEEMKNICESVSSHSNELEKFNEIYSYFKNNIKFTYDEEIEIQNVFVDKISSYDYYALAINSCLRELGFDSKVINGVVGDEKHLWNQVKINDEWYNFDIAYDISSKNKIKNVFRSNLLNDEQFYKTHTPSLDSKPEICENELQELKKEIKNEENKVGFFQKIYLKILGIFRFNKSKALPAPEDEDK